MSRARRRTRVFSPFFGASCRRGRRSPLAGNDAARVTRLGARSSRLSLRSTGHRTARRVNMLCVASPHLALNTLAIAAVAAVATTAADADAISCGDKRR